jgi:glucan 1,3-beta-glucosidase
MNSSSKWICKFEDFSGNGRQSSSRVRNDFHIRGTSLGGWLVLEPWITPSLFYQFLGKTEKFGEDAKNHIAIDSHTFCTALGAKEANRQLKRHWRTWVDEAQILNLSLSGVETLRVPVGDWMYKPYYPFIGCWDGAIEELDRVLRLCEKYHINVILDLHAMKMSQNGLDNSGDTGDYSWGVIDTSMYGRRESRYRHWDIRGGNWIGNYNVTSQLYVTFNATNVKESLDVVELIVRKYKDVSVVIGIEPVNEPWWKIPLDELKDFYWESYQIVQAISPHWITLFHDSFRLWPSTFGGDWMKNCNNWAMDTHLYLAWSDPKTLDEYISMTCGSGYNIALMESIGVPVIVGEWSLATDNCALWLNGLNDNVPGYPKVECDRVQCPAPYMGNGQPGAPPNNPSVDTLDPRGSGGESFVINGTCPRDKSFPGEAAGLQQLAHAHLKVFDRLSHGNFFWNFRTELEPRWDYQVATKSKWIPTQWSADSDTSLMIGKSCEGFNFSNFGVHDMPETVDGITQYTVAWLRYPFIFASALMLFFFLRKFAFATPSRSREYQFIPSDVECRTIL